MRRSSAWGTVSNAFLKSKYAMSLEIPAFSDVYTSESMKLIVGLSMSECGGNRIDWCCSTKLNDPIPPTHGRFLSGYVRLTFATKSISLVLCSCSFFTLIVVFLRLV